jgi:DivIVA domain-containing protein
MNPRSKDQPPPTRLTLNLDRVSLQAAGSALKRTRFREGYAIDEVDDFLRRAGVALDEHRRAAPLSLTPEAVLSTKFQATKFREGYDQGEVDDLLDQVAANLRA